jgi:competence protein ComEC
VIAWRIFPWSVRFAIRAAELVVVSCVVELAMTLPMAVYFHRITIFALPVNLLILPMLLVLMPAALVTMLMLVVWPAAAMIPAMVVALVLHIGVGLVHLFGSMALGDFRIPNPLLWQSAAFCALLGVAIVLAHESLGRGTPWMRRGAWVALALAALAAVIAAAGGSAEGRNADGGDRRGTGRLAAGDYAGWKDTAGGWRGIWRGSKAGATRF